MNKIITDEKKIEEVLTRGVEQIYPSKEGLKKLLMSGQKIKLYCGYDPSAPSLHIGNAITINKLSQFQELGHQVIFLIGDFTGMIGDPTDKTAARKKLSREEVLNNCKNYVKQASAYLKFDGDNPAIVEYNSKWHDKLTFKDLIEITSNFTVQQMIQRDMFQKRIENEKPIFLHEFLYPVAQGYDSYYLDVDLEIGGNDQMFNMMAGRDLQKALKNKEKYVLTLKLLADDTGKKMGKSEGNAVFLDTDYKNMYGIIMSWPDSIIVNAFELTTKVSMQEIEQIKEKLKDPNTNPRDLKMRLAYEITALVHGKEKADEAQNHFIKTIQQKEIPDDIPQYKLNEDKNILDLMLETKIISSKSEGRRLLKENGIKINSQIINDEKMIIKKGQNLILQRGKRHFIKII